MGPVLWIRVPNWLGDVCMAMPALELAVEHLGKANGQVVLVGRSPLIDLLRQSQLKCPCLTVDRQERLLEPVPDSLRPSAGVLLTNTLRTAWKFWKWGVPHRVGTGMRWWLRPLLNEVAAKPREYSQAEKQADLAPPGWTGATTMVGYHNLVAAGLKRFGLQVDREESPELVPRLFLGAEADQEAQNWLDAHGLANASGPILGFQAAAAYGTAKRWPPEKLGRALAMVLEQIPDARVVGLGSPKELEDLRQVVAALDGYNPALRRRVVLPETFLGLAGFFALVRRLDLVLANDSGPMHVAVASGTPCVAMFGPTNWLSTGYRDGGRYRMIRESGIACAPCMKRHCPIDHRCMSRIEEPRVVAAAVELLKLQEPEANGRNG
jgi:heptosyltransferase-2